MGAILVFLLSQSFAEEFERPAKFARDSSDSEEQDDQFCVSTEVAMIFSCSNKVAPSSQNAFVF
jgi:hypothetical protein